MHDQTQNKFTHVVGQSDQRYAVSCQKDVAMAQLTTLPRGLVHEQPLDSYQSWPLLAWIHSASHTESQTLTALQQAHLGCGFCNMKHRLSWPDVTPLPLEFVFRCSHRRTRMNMTLTVEEYRCYSTSFRICMSVHCPRRTKKNMTLRAE